MNGSPVTPASIAGGTYTRNDRVETVEALYLDVTEVTASAYAACVGTGACTAATAGAGTRDPRVLPWAHALEPTYCNAGVPGLEQHPINCVDWAQAVAYCSWRGKRLPTTAEWVWAARGREEARTFPWGTDETAEKACWRLPNPPPNGTCAVGSLPAGASRDGVLDLAGNVGEWTASGAYPTYIDSWWGGFELLEDLESVASGGDGSRRSASIGFRCAKTQ